MKKPKLIIVIPCYNEEAVLPVTAPMFLNKVEEMISLGKISDDSGILFVNDGSRDATWSIISGLASANSHYHGICLSRNQGHQNALLAGLMDAKNHCDITISIDCDGQDDINAMNAMVDAYLDGCEVVYGVRSSRETDSFFKRFSAECFYKVLQKLGGEIIYNHADYRLVSARALEALSSFEEVNIFLRGMIPMVGFKSTSVFYERHERIAGESHYPLRKMLALAFDGITSLSIKPIRIITGLGFAFSLLAMLLIIYVFVSFFMDRVVPGWSSSLIAICFIGGIQLISLGVIGEYIGKIYLETKHRPRYIISEKTDTE